MLFQITLVIWIAISEFINLFNPKVKNQRKLDKMRMIEEKDLFEKFMLFLYTYENFETKEKMTFPILYYFKKENETWWKKRVDEYCELFVKEKIFEEVIKESLMNLSFYPWDCIWNYDENPEEVKFAAQRFFLQEFEKIKERFEIKEEAIKIKKCF